MGCAYGATTVFLKKLMAEAGVEKDYIAMDTFSGFAPEQADFEIKSRRKRPGLKESSRSTSASGSRYRCAWRVPAMSAH